MLYKKAILFHYFFPEDENNIESERRENQEDVDKNQFVKSRERRMEENEREDIRSGDGIPNILSRARICNQLCGWIRIGGCGDIRGDDVGDSVCCSTKQEYEQTCIRHEQGGTARFLYIVGGRSEMARERCNFEFRTWGVEGECEYVGFYE